MFGSTAVGRRNTFTLPTSLPSRKYSIGSRNIFFGAYDLFNQGKRKCMSENLASSALQDAAKMTNFCLISSRALNHD